MKTLFPFVLWLLFVYYMGSDFSAQSWDAVLVVFSALVLVPYGLHLMDLPQGRWYWLISGGFAVAYAQFPSKLSVALAIPYMLLALGHAVEVVINIIVFKHHFVAKWLIATALIYWMVGAAWAVFFLADIHPFNFDSVIVGLTAAHFHVAGFALTTVVFCLYNANPNIENRWLSRAAHAGMPLVAIGITRTQLNGSHLLEQIAGFLFALYAIAVAVQQTSLVRQKEQYPLLARCCWLAAVICLYAGGALAILYTLRFNTPFAWVNIPNMKLWHGTLNAIGFGGLSLLGWAFAARKRSPIFPSLFA